MSVTVFCDDEGCIYNADGFCDCDRIHIVGNECNGPTATGETEKARLREFAARLVEYVDPASHQDTCNIECPAYARCYGKSTCAFPDWVLERADELGIEVD